MFWAQSNKNCSLAKAHKKVWQAQRATVIGNCREETKLSSTLSECLAGSEKLN